MQSFHLHKPLIRQNLGYSEPTLHHFSKKEKKKWNAKEKELISKYRKGLIWKDIN
jgi:hypothetical protein